VETEPAAGPRTPRRPDLAERLDLAPHPEGGWFRETWRSAVTFQPEGYAGPRRVATAIYYLLYPGERSRWHVVRSDELWLWHSGGPLALRLGGAATGPVPGEVVVLGGDVTAGHRPQALVPGGVWQSAEPAGSAPVLVSCVVAPGFEYDDFRIAAGP
jgi:predicted cupin superfamily sugar epimerase